MAIINDAVMEALDEAIANGDTELYEELKTEYWLVDLYDYENEKRSFLQGEYKT